MDATVHLVRHGKVENPKGVIYGRIAGFHLSELGRRQAGAAGQHLKDRDVGAIWASPLERAQETAEAIAKHHPSIEITTDDRLIESLNNFEGSARNLWVLLRNPRNWWHLRNPVGPSWGETFPDIRERMLEAIGEAVQAAEGREVIIVSHQTPTLVARFGLAKRNIPPWLGFAPCQTGSVTSMAIKDGKVLSASYFAPPG